jgi:hypothetical protein
MTLRRLREPFDGRCTKPIAMKALSATDDDHGRTWQSLAVGAGS